MAMATFAPEEFARDAQPLVVQEDEPDIAWTPIYRHDCTFGPAGFREVMINLIKNPNILTSWLFRADILYQNDEPESLQQSGPFDKQPKVPSFRDLALHEIIVRKLVPRSIQRDNPLEQTCLFFHNVDTEGSQTNLVVYLPHVASADELPFYHPHVRGVAYLHQWSSSGKVGRISVHYALFDKSGLSNKLTRTALNLMTVLYKHGEGNQLGYEKRVQLDTVVPQAALQDRYRHFKEKYARKLISQWQERTDPDKHVFEDLGIAAFLIELWADMYKESPFPGFIDIGCGNGLLVHILNEEGYSGWGFDARRRKSWTKYNTVLPPNPELGQSVASNSLRQMVLLPLLAGAAEGQDTQESPEGGVHDGSFPKGTFIISNHADELTPWTPLLATASECPFIAIPCCSHNLAGARFRASPPKNKQKASSTYASLIEWVAEIGSGCGWEVEREVLRIPSTRNTALMGRRRAQSYSAVNVEEVIARYGGASGYVENALKLVISGPRSH